MITEPVDEVQRLLDEEGRMLHAIDLDGETYMRSEGGSLLVGVCKDLSERCFARTRVADLKGLSVSDEQDCRPWAADGSPWDYGENELLEPDLERISPELIKAYERYPWYFMFFAIHLRNRKNVAQLL